jgi:hypothetical protein
LPVRILGIPLPLIDRARQHQESLEREFRLIALSDPDDTSHVTARLLALVAELEDRFGSFSRTQTAELDAALARGDATIDLEFLVPEAAQAASWRLSDLLDEADEYCRDGELLTLATPDDCVELRRWYLGEFVTQIAGASPTAWDQRERSAEGGPPGYARLDGSLGGVLGDDG